MLNFITFASKYKLVNKKLTSQPQKTVPRVFPVFSSNPKGPNFGTNLGRLHRKMLGVINQVLTIYILLHGKHSFKHNMLNSMYLIGMKNCKL